MSKNWLLLVGALALVGCKNDDTNSKGDDTADDTAGDTGDSNVDSDSDSETGDTDTEVPCETLVIETTPDDGTDDFYYLDELEVVFSEDGSAAAIELTQDGAPVAVNIGWGKGNFKASVMPISPLHSSTDYVLHTNVCETDYYTNFRTDVYGDPLTDDPATLVGSTYVILLTEARFIEPAGAEALLGLVFNKPLLLGVKAADSKEISFLATEGRALPTGGYEQVMSSDIWAFPAADFTTAPFFSAESDDVIFTWNDYEVPVGNFQLQGTFAPDGSSYGGGTVQGLADTRDLSTYYDTSDPSYICDEVLAPFGIDCQDCIDGEPYCIYIEADEIEAEREPGLTLVE